MQIMSYAQKKSSARGFDSLHMRDTIILPLNACPNSCIVFLSFVTVLSIDDTESVHAPSTAIHSASSQEFFENNRYCASNKLCRQDPSNEFVVGCSKSVLASSASCHSASTFILLPICLPSLIHHSWHHLNLASTRDRSCSRQSP